MDKTRVEIRVKEVSGAYRVSMRYMPFCKGFGDAMYHIDLYHEVERRVTKLAHVFGIENVVHEDHELAFIPQSRDLNYIMQTLNKNKDIIASEEELRRSEIKLEVVEVKKH